MAVSPTSIPVDFSSVTVDENNTNDNVCPYQSWTYTVIPVYILLIAVMGIILNVFVLTVFILHKKACTVAEIYLSNLAAADLLLVSCLPFWAVNISNEFNWTFGEFMCKAVNVGMLMNFYCSIYFLVLVSIDRYLALVHPLSQETLRRPRYAKVACFLVWAFGFLLTTPALIFRKMKYFPEFISTFCYLEYPNLSINLLCESMIFIFGFVIPVSIISFCTIKIIKTLGNRLIEGVHFQNTDNKATTLVLAVLLAFLICWVPFEMTKIPDFLKQVEILTECNSLQILEGCKQIFKYFGIFNSVLNPILYVIVGKNFQKKVQEVFKQCKPNRKPVHTFSSTRTSLSKHIKAQDALA
ncbi:B2 bradykinin receptor-like [Odontesthes bonariensis]|uniref:B2 bradykinin receptor-like n=1 Tax=Odontesthes bonariensis TaxID=219752 RepID=UPI003F581807